MMIISIDLALNLLLMEAYCVKILIWSREAMVRIQSVVFVSTAKKACSIRAKITATEVG